MAAARRAFHRAAQRGDLRPDLDPNVDLELIVTVVPSMCAFHATVLGEVVDEAFVTRVLDRLLLPAAGDLPAGSRRLGPTP